MKHFILAGEEAVNYFQQENWSALQGCVLMENMGEIYGFEYSNSNSVTELLEQLKGWNDFIELSSQDIKDIETNTLIEFDKKENVKLPIYWSTIDFESQAEQNFNELKKDNPKEFLHLENWEQLYDKSKFPELLEKMINNHDAELGINWLTIEFYIGECEIK